MRTVKKYFETKRSLENLKPYARRRPVVELQLTQLMTKVLQEGNRIEKRAERTK